MNSRERVLCSLAWQEPDRAPIMAHMTPEIHQRLKDYFGGADVLEKLGCDFRYVGPRYTGAIKPPRDGVRYDMWGTGYTTIGHGSGAYEESTIQPLAKLKTLQDVENYPWPRAEDWDYAAIAANCRKHRQYARYVGSSGMPDILNGVSRGRGMEQVMMDVGLRDEVGLAIINRRVQVCYEHLRRCLEAGQGQIEILYVGEDCGNQNGRMFSPRDFDEIFRPKLQRFIDLGHEFGAKVMMHSCGDTHDIMPTFIQMGLDVLDSMQPEPKGMVLDDIRRLCMGKLAFCGLISTQQTLPFGTVQQCRSEARHRLDVLARGGGYIFAPAHNIQSDTPMANVLAIFSEALGAKL